MEGRFPRAIRFVLSRCADPSQEGDFNRWYSQVHLRDMLASGLVRAALRFRNTDATASDAPYLAIYETERDDLEALSREVARLVERLRAEGRLHPALEVTGITMWRRTGPQFWTGKTGRAPVTGILAVTADCSDPSREAEFNAWYNTVHALDLLSTGTFHTAYRYEAVGPHPGQGKYLAIYETDAPDPARAVWDTLNEHRPRWRSAGRYVDTLRIVWLGVFARLE